MTPAADVVIVGAGIVGLATGLALARRGLTTTILEAEEAMGRHQTGHNSGVIHAGLYYAPGSLKARLCTEGREAMYAFCQEEGVPVERCGKLVVATAEREIAGFEALAERAQANGLKGVERLNPRDIRSIEPHAAGIAGLFVPQTGITDFRLVASAMRRRFEALGGRVIAGARVTRVDSDGTGPNGSRRAIRVRHTGADGGASAGSLLCQGLIGCAGLHADRVARMAGYNPPVRIVPFRGEYYHLRRPSLVRNLIYPVPDPALPFLGVHLTRTTTGVVEAGPNAVLALSRHGYGWGDVSARDVADMLSWPGFWRLSWKHWRVGLSEMHRSLSRSAFAASVRRLLPGLRDDDLAPGGSGVRAQAVDRQGSLVDDFVFAEAESQIHVLNAPSPAATASLAIGEHLADLAMKRFEMEAV